MPRFQTETLPELLDTTLLDVDKDRQMAFGHLTVTRADGQTERILKAVPIFRKHRFSATVRGTVFLDACDRVQALHQASASGTERNPYTNRAQVLADSMYLDLQMRREGRSDPIGALRLMSLGTSLGYLLAKAEQVAEVLPKAECGVRVQRAASTAGRVSGERRRRNALPWEEKATAIAIEKASGCETLSELVCAIANKLDDGVREPPSETTLSNLVRRLQANGRVPPYPRQRHRL